MVHVTKSNFLLQLSDFLKHLPSSSYIAIDEEMTGIQLPNSGRPSKVETPHQRYVNSLKGVPERYAILQVGVVLFHKNPQFQQTLKNLDSNREGGPKLETSHCSNVESVDTDDMEHSFLHREGMLNQDKLEEATEKEEHASHSINTDAAPNSEYTSRSYNFYLFPNNNNTTTTENGTVTSTPREVTLNPSTVKFLLENDMDFNTVFREGVSFTLLSHAQSLKEKFFQKKRSLPQDNGSGKIKTNLTWRDKVKLTRPEDIAFVARAMAGLREWIDSENGTDGAEDDSQIVTGPRESDSHAVSGHNGTENDETDENSTKRQVEGTSLVLPPCNPFLRRCLYETIEAEYSGLVLERADTGSTSCNQIRVIRLSPEEKKQRETRLLLEEWNNLLVNTIGFTTIFEAISDACNGKEFTDEQTALFLSGLSPDISVPVPNNCDTAKKGRNIPVVIHNGLMDLLFLLTHCHDGILPDSFEETKCLIRRYFPHIYDSKVLSTEYSDAVISQGNTSLADLFNALCNLQSNSNTFKAPLIVNVNGESNEQIHEASWDAYMTGCVFNSLCQKIILHKVETNHVMTFDQLLCEPESTLRDWLGLNKIFLMQSLYTIDLESSSGPAGFHDPLSKGFSVDTTFYVSGTFTTVSTKDILHALLSDNHDKSELLKGLKYDIIWVDDSSFFIGTILDRTIAADDKTALNSIASHVTTKFKARFADVTFCSFVDYLSDKHKEKDHNSILDSIVSVVKSPINVLGNVLGVGKRSCEIETLSTTSKHRRVG